MAYDEQAAQRVRRILSERRGTIEKKMMGGVCFMVSGKMCCGVSGRALMVRVGPEAYEATLAEPYVRPLEFAGRRPRGFVCVEPPGFRTDSAVKKWLQRGIDFVSTLPAELAKRKSRRKTPRR